MWIRTILLAAACTLAGIAGALAQGETINQLSPGAALSGSELLPMFQNANPAVTTTPAAIATYGASAANTLTNKTIASSTDVLGGVTMTLGADATGDMYYRNGSGVLARLPVGSSGQVLGVFSGLPSWAAAGGLGSGAVLNATPSNPTGTNSNSFVMMGLGGTCKLTPTVSTRVRLTFTGNGKDSNVNGEVQPAYGTGTAPSNAATATGTVVGNPVAIVSGPTGSSVFTSWSLNVIITGLSAGTAYWFDVQLEDAGGGTAAISSITCTAQEI